MKRIALALLVSIAAAGFAAAQPGRSLTWFLYKDDGVPAAFLAAVPEGEEDNPEPHYPFLMSCSLEDDWTMIVSDVDPKQLGAAIANGEQPTFALVVEGEAGKSESSDYYPEIGFSQMEGLWEYSTIWDLATLDHLLTAKAIRVKGTGIDVALPTATLTKSLQDFKAACEKLGENLPDEGAEEDAVQ